LQKLNGDAFDKAFVKQIVKDHQKDIKYFEKEQNSLKDPQLKSFARQTLPVLQEHLQMAQHTQTGCGARAPWHQPVDAAAEEEHDQRVEQGESERG